MAITPDVRARLGSRVSPGTTTANRKRQNVRQGRPATEMRGIVLALAGLGAAAAISACGGGGGGQSAVYQHGYDYGKNLATGAAGAMIVADPACNGASTGNGSYYEDDKASLAPSDRPLWVKGCIAGFNDNKPAQQTLPHATWSNR
jgi:hypothetical protein